MISVIVPVYNVEPYLHECIESILNQTYQDLEILLIDDGSQDRCGEICEEYARIDPRIRVFHTENHGLSASRNLGLQMATGEYIGFVDSDDWIEPDMYETLLRRIEETGTSISACAITGEFQGNKHPYNISDAVYTGTDAVKAMICKLSNAAWNKLYKKECWTDIRYPENHTFEDIATTYKVVMKVKSISCVPQQLYHYRKRVGSIAQTPSMENLMDCWRSFYDRYSYLSSQPEFQKNSTLILHLEKQVASAAVTIWRWIYGIPKQQRDYVFLHMVSDFVRKNFPTFGKKNWRFPLRAGFFFTLFPNDASFATMYVLNGIYTFFGQMNRKPFPSGSFDNNRRHGFS